MWATVSPPGLERLYRLGKWGVLAATLIGVAACGSIGHGDPPTAASPPPLRQGSPSQRVLPCTADRLPLDYIRAAAALGWAVEHVNTSPDASTTPWHADVIILMPDARHMRVTTTQLDPATARFTAQVLPFGDPTPEVNYLDALANTLRSPKARDYGGRFELP